MIDETSQNEACQSRCPPLLSRDSQRNVSFLMAARVLTQADAMELKKINVGITGGETGNRDLAESRQGMSLRAQPKFTSCRLKSNTWWACFYWTRSMGL